MFDGLYMRFDSNINIIQRRFQDVKLEKRIKQLSVTALHNITVI